MIATICLPFLCQRGGVVRQQKDLWQELWQIIQVLFVQGLWCLCGMPQQHKGAIGYIGQQGVEKLEERNTCIVWSSMENQQDDQKGGIQTPWWSFWPWDPYWREWQCTVPCNYSFFKIKIMEKVPFENYEAEEFAKWLRNNWYKFTHIANESGQKGTRNIIIMMARKKRMWVSPWFPDFCIVLKRGSLCGIELKRRQPVLKNGTLGVAPSEVSPQQEEWIAVLDAIDNISASICYWWEDARDKVLEWEAL